MTNNPRADLVIVAKKVTERYHFNARGGINDGIASYSIVGKQYFALTSGGGGSPTLFVFTLSAKH